MGEEKTVAEREELSQVEKVLDLLFFPGTIWSDHPTKGRRTEHLTMSKRGT